MLNVIRAIPAQFAASVAAVANADLDPAICVHTDDYHLAAMGGSALSGHLLNDYAGDELIRISSDYRVPRSVGDNSLVVCASYSGTTEETISALRDAKERGAHIVAISNGGELARIAEEEWLSFIKIPDCEQPCCAIGHFFASLLMLFDHIGVLEPQARVLENLAEYLGENMEAFETKGRGLAGKLKDRVPIFYGPGELAGATRGMKIKFNETVNVPAFYNVLPEANHNEMVGYTQTIMPAAAVFLMTRNMLSRVSRRMDVMARVLDGKMPVVQLELGGVNVLSDIFEAQLVADFAAYYLATEHYKVDPDAIELVGEFKRLLVEDDA